MEHWWNEGKTIGLGEKLFQWADRFFFLSTSVFRSHHSISAPCPYFIYQPLTPFNISNFSVENCALQGYDAARSAKQLPLLAA